MFLTKMNKIKNEWVYFWTALMFFTRIPIPFKLPYSSEIMNKSQKYYSWVGIVVGLITALSYYVFQVLLNENIAIVLSMITSVFLTGAFHEDGFTDVCDSFGGGYGKEKIMTIMKDSRIGAYGTIGIALLLLLKFVTLVEIANKQSLLFFIFIIIFAHSLSRFIAGTAIYTHAYVRDIDTSKIKPIAAEALPLSSLIIGIVGFLIPIIVFQEWKYLLVLPVAYSSKMMLCAYFKKHIGGYTGDCLGTIQQVSEVVIYLTAVAIWKFI